MFLVRESDLHSDFTCPLIRKKETVSCHKARGVLEAYTDALRSASWPRFRLSGKHRWCRKPNTWPKQYKPAYLVQSSQRFHSNMTLSWIHSLFSLRKPYSTSILKTKQGRTLVRAGPGAGASQNSPAPLAGTLQHWLKYIASQNQYEPYHQTTHVAKLWMLHCNYCISLNKHTCLNNHIPRLLTFPGNISGNSKPILIKFSAPNVKVLRGLHSQFHGDQTRVRVRFVPPCPARLFSRIWYSRHTWLASPPSIKHRLF